VFRNRNDDGVCTRVVSMGLGGKMKRTANIRNGGKKIILVTKSLMKICRNLTKTRIVVCGCVCTLLRSCIASHVL